MRMFVAVLPPQHAIDDLEEFVAPRREAGRELRWTAVEQWHLTLAFMAAVPPRKVDDLVERLGRAAHRRTAFEVRLAGAGTFPNPAKAKLLYAGVRTDRGEELQRLAVGARAAAHKAGADADGGSFHPHLTLARSGRPFEATRWLRVFEAYDGPAWPVDEIALIESHLGEGPNNRPRYEVLERFDLTSPS